MRGRPEEETGMEEECCQESNGSVRRTRTKAEMLHNAYFCENSCFKLGMIIAHSGNEFN